MENEIKPRKEREKYKISYRSVYEKNKKILNLLSKKPTPTPNK